MQRIVELGARTLTNDLQHAASCVLTVSQPFGNKHLPLRKAPIHCIEPSVNTSFTCIDFLATADEADDHRPIFVSVHVRDQKLRLGICEAGAPFLSQHKSSGLLQVPRSLRLIEYDDVLYRRTDVDQRIIAEVVNVLDERLYAFTNFPFPYLFTLFLAPRDLISR